MWSPAARRPRPVHPAALGAAHALGIGGDALERQGHGSTSAVYAAADVILIVAPPYADPAAVAAKVTLAGVIAQDARFVRPLWPAPRHFAGALVTAWERVPLARGAMDWESAGDAVRSLHRLDDETVQRRSGTALPSVADCQDIRGAVDRLRAAGRLSPRSGAVLTAVAGRIEGELAGLDPRRGLVHGDLHRPNLLPGTTGVVLCDTDEIAVGAPAYDLGFLTDPARPSVPAAARRAFENGYGEPLPDPAVARTFARAAHLRRTVAVLHRPPTLRERYFDSARLGAWAAMDARWQSDLVPVIAQPRARQLGLALRGLLRTGG